MKNSAARRPEVAEFLRFYLENVDKLAVEGRLRSDPTADDKAANQETLAKLLGPAARPSKSRAQRDSWTCPVPTGTCRDLIVCPTSRRHPFSPIDPRRRRPDLWSGHSRFLAFWEAVVTVGLVVCALDHGSDDGGDFSRPRGAEIRFFQSVGRQPARIFVGHGVEARRRSAPIRHFSA